MLARAVPNVFYCLWLLQKKRTRNNFGKGGLSHWGLALVMAALHVAHRHYGKPARHVHWRMEA